MKTILAIFFALLTTAFLLQADVVVRWTFDSQPPDGSASTGTTVPAIGVGTAQTLGGVVGSYASGSGTVPTDDSGWSTTSYPPGTNYNRTAGVQFQMDTTGYTNLVLSWAERHSSTASRYTRLRYSTDGYFFYDGEVLSLTQDGVFVQRSVDLAGIAGAANNPFLTVQFLTEFESSATGSGTNGYVATKAGSSYSSAGTIRYDMVTLSGTLMPGVNTPPNVSSIPNLVLRVGQRSEAVGFTVWDFEDAGSSLMVMGISSDPAVVPDGTLSFSGETGHRWLTVTAGEQPGTAIITVQVYDSGGKAASTTFSVTVLPLNTAPGLVLSCARTNTVAGTPAGPVELVVGDMETAAGLLEVSASSFHPELVPEGSIVFGGSGSNRTMVITPEAGRTGVAALRVKVSDGTNETAAPFAVMIAPSADVVLFDAFTYADGSLITNSGFWWGTRSGTAGEAQVTGGELEVSSELTEDVVATLANGPFDTGYGAVLYASFRVRALGLPRQTPDYFAHFVGSSLRGRVFVGATNAAAGCYRVSVANSTGEPVQLGADIGTNEQCLVVMRYEVDNAATAVWVNPVAETDPAAYATDTQTGTRITGFAFRQSSGLGTVLHVDDVRVGLSFGAVVPGGGTANGRLRHALEGGELVLTWDEAGWVLERAPELAGPFVEVSGAVSPHRAAITGGSGFFRLRKRAGE